MEPDVLICGEEPCEFRADNTNDIAEHGDQEQSSIKREGETSTTRGPDRPCQSIEGSQLRVSDLQIPTQSEKGALDTVEDDIEYKPSRVEELALKPRFTHGILSDRLVNGLVEWAKIEKWGLPQMQERKTRKERKRQRRDLKSVPDGEMTR